MNKHILRYMICFCLLTNAWLSANASVRTKVTREAIEKTLEHAARRSGRKVSEKAARQSVRKASGKATRQSARKASERAAKKTAVETLERLTKTYGDDVLRVVREGGIELVEAVPKYGDEVIEVAMKSSPKAQRALAKNVPELLPLAKRVGVEALELEAKSSGMATRVFKVFGDDAGRLIARNTPVEEIPRLLAYAEKADNSATRELLFKSFQKEGKSLFERIPPKLVLAGGLTTAMLYGTHELTEPARAVGEAIRKSDELALETVKKSFQWVAIGFFSLAVILLWRFRLMPWHGGRMKEATAVDKEEPKTEVSEQESSAEDS